MKDILFYVITTIIAVLFISTGVSLFSSVKDNLPQLGHLAVQWENVGKVLVAQLINPPGSF